ncbi:arogenate dehydrogenase [Neosynechococcus sphagnicola sy1]|uniref:Arogenate dehydrogenase n=2 Tax=Neosynechococcus TaxID=1501143 RepID=A0A098TKU3_9CYAN|nr:arogenate dehydrogenase [Neosynechococcus sphagnicola sy1]
MRIGIVGLGLMGGSLALDLRPLGHEILGVSRHQRTCEQAIALGMVDAASTDLALLTAAEVVFLCTPLAALEPTVGQLVPYLHPETILTDVGSVKAPIVEAISPLWPNFVGGHPMAGTAESGLEAAQPHLFVGKPYVLTAIATTPEIAITTIATLVQQLQAHLYYCLPTDHDQAVAWISHLPVMVSASLIAACCNNADTKTLKLAQALASSGFRDTSRVGGGSPELGVMMARFNRHQLLHTLCAYRNQLDQCIAWIEQEDWGSLESQLHQTQEARPQFHSALS